jgi:hypothetical protein
VTLTPRWRKLVLTLHVSTGVGLLGVDLVLLAFGIAGKAGYDPAVVYPAMGFVGLAVFAPLSLVMWLIGFLNAWGTRWGLLRYWWVTVKLVIATALVVLVFVALRPQLLAALHDGAALSDRHRASLLAAPIVSSTLLVISTVLSVYKPWGRTRLGPPLGTGGGVTR